MLSRIESLMMATVRRRHLKRATTAFPIPVGLKSGQRATLSQTAGELYTENVLLPLWPT